MSRIGKEPVKMLDGVTVAVDGQKVTVKGKLGELSYTMHDGITAKVEDGQVKVGCAGVSQGYTKTLTIEGTGFKAVLKGQELALSLGFASPKIFQVPQGITIKVENDGLKIVVTGISKDMVGEAAARIRSFYPAEPYKGKGIKYEGEHIRRKQGKKVA